MNVQTVRSTDQPDQRNARRDAPHPRAVESTEAGSAMADDRREDILKDLPEEVKLLLQFEVLKELKRQNPLAMAERKERVGEHSWHLALSVLLLAEFASEPFDSKAIHRLVDLWQEYEDQETSEARFVKGMDAFLPIVLNYMNVEHSSWSQHGVHSDQVRKRLGCVRDAIEPLAIINDRMIDQARAEGYLE